MAMDKGRAWASAWGMEMGQGPPGRFGGRGLRAGRVSERVSGSSEEQRKRLDGGAKEEDRISSR